MLSSAVLRTGHGVSTIGIRRGKSWRVECHRRARAKQKGRPANALPPARTNATASAITSDSEPPFAERISAETKAGKSPRPRIPDRPSRLS